jgi:hypothetical protein
MISEFVREQKRYTRDNLKSLFRCSDADIIRIIKRLKEYGVLKKVKNTKEQLDMSDLIDEDIEVSDEDETPSNYLYVFTFVGIIIIEGRVLKCYPKYLFSKQSPTEELKQIIKVLKKYNSKEQIIYMYNDGGKTSTFNRLAVMVFLLNDYFENGIYTNTQDIIETNGMGEINWDRTINNTFPLTHNDRPFYVELQTRKRISDDNDFFKRLHECLLTICSKELSDADLPDLLDIDGVEVSDETLDNLGEDEYLLWRIEKEMNVQFNTRKQEVLKTMAALIANKASVDDVYSFSMFGTNNFNMVWEKICAEVMENQLHTKLADLKLPGKLIIPASSPCKPTDELIDIIEKPKWMGNKADDTTFEKMASDTLTPDLISIHNNGNDYTFVIFDAKYYTIQLDEYKPLRGQPGVSDITKQYLYQLAYRDFVRENGFSSVKNCFIMPTEEDHIIEKGAVRMDMLGALQLECIQVRQLPAKHIFSYYLALRRMKIDELNL